MASGWCTDCLPHPVEEGVGVSICGLEFWGAGFKGLGLRAWLFWISGLGVPFQRRSIRNVFPYRKINPKPLTLNPQQDENFPCGQFGGQVFGTTITIVGG